MRLLSFRRKCRLAIDFFKAHYEYLLPFSFLNFIITLLLGFVKKEASLAVFLSTLPLSFSIPYFAHRVTNGSKRRFGLFFEVYSSSFRFFAAIGMKVLIFALLFSPLFYLIFDVWEKYSFDQELIRAAMRSGDFLPSKAQTIFTILSIVTSVIIYPLFMFIEHFSVLENRGIIDATKKSMQLGRAQYPLLFSLMLLQFISISVGTIMTCGFIFLLGFPFFNLVTYFIYRESILKKESF